MKEQNKKAIADAIMAGAKLKEEGKPMPYLEGDDDLDFSEGGGGKKDKDEANITKAFQTLWKI
jgi:hypothetical protein